MKIPYGEADFYKLRTRGQVYVDRTDRISVVGELGDRLLFLRPRRFGKSLWLSTLAAYHDLRTADEHERLFGDLAVDRLASPPPAHRYFVLRWDFSDIDPDPPLRGVNAGIRSRHARLANEIHGYLLGSVEDLLLDYGGHLPQTVDVKDDAFRTLDNLLAVIRQTPYKLYLLIDEYDNFANEVLTSDADTYEELVTSDGPFKRLFKWVKAAMGAGKGLDRFFITGVSPLAMSDVTSGMNVAESVYLYPELSDLCGFAKGEVRGLLEDLHAEKLTEGAVPWTVAGALDMMRDWYNGYRFATDADEAVYNPTLVFHFLKHLQRTGKYPPQMLDSNLATDEDKLDYVARTAAGQDAVIDVIREEKPLEIPQIFDRFKLHTLLDRSGQGTSFLGSYLYYFGMLTLKRGRTATRNLELVVPNEVIRGLYVERIRELLLPFGDSRTAAEKILATFWRDGDLLPLCDFVETILFPTFSNRDSRWANELTVKTVFLMLLWNEAAYVSYSEPELGHKFADLCLLRRPDARASSLWDLLFEFKRLSLTELGMSGKDVKASSREELMEHKLVKKSLDKAEEQIRTYRAALEKKLGEAPSPREEQEGKTLRLRAYAVVALGFERLVVRPSPVTSP